MKHSISDVQIEIMKFLSDGEYHSLVGTVIGVGKNLRLTSDEMKEIHDSVKKNIKKITFSNSKLNHQVRTEVSHLRDIQFIKNFPKTKKLGFFAITDKGLNLVDKSRKTMKETIDTELKKLRKKYH